MCAGFYLYTLVSERALTQRLPPTLMSLAGDAGQAGRGDAGR